MMIRRSRWANRKRASLVGPVGLLGGEPGQPPTRFGQQLVDGRRRATDRHGFLSSHIAGLAVRTHNGVVGDTLSAAAERWNHVYARGDTATSRRKPHAAASLAMLDRCAVSPADRLIDVRARAPSLR